MSFNTEKEFNNHKGEVTCKYNNYFEVYNHIFLKVLSIREIHNKPIHLLELGILKGGSLQIWKKIFIKSKISGLDLKKSINDNFIDCFKGSQTEEKVFDLIKNKNGLIDIMIDDASHIAKFSIKSFFNFLKTSNYFYGYICEDIDTHLNINRFGFNLKDTINFIEINKILALGFANKDSSTIFSNQIIGYFGNEKQQLFDFIQRDEVFDLEYFNKIKFKKCSSIIKKLIRENKINDKLIIKNFDEIFFKDSLFIFCFLLSQRKTIKELKPKFIPEDLEQEILTFPIFVKKIVFENKLIVINYSENLNDSEFSIAKNYGPKYKLFFFEIESRIKNNFIKFINFISSMHIFSS